MPPRDAIEIADIVEAALQGAGTAERAEGAKRYLKSDLAFVGADTAAVRGTVRRALAQAGSLGRRGVLVLVDELWARGVFELRAASVEVLVARGELLNCGDISFLARLVRDSHTWALVDSLAVHVAGPLVVRFPRLGEVLDQWAGDADFWLRRAAMLALLLPLRRGSGDFERFSRYADRMLGENEFFIRKAIGWVLREVGKNRPELVAAWLAPRTDRISGVSVREAVRYLPESRRRSLLAAYRDGRPEASARRRRGV